ncbi:MAG: FlgD immunoglobulin-like domain containing protein, partial [Limisphaerales bacterium]
DSRLGFSVAGAGDVNGDGRADFIVGAPYADPAGVFNAGSASVFSGADGALLYQINGAVASNLLGAGVAGAGDLNGDGRADFLIGSLSQAFAYSGANGTLLYQKGGGPAVAGAGDVNGDGSADFIVGAPYADPGGLVDAGSAYLFSGATGALLYQKNGVAAADNLGNAVAGVGDGDGDGRADFIVGAQGADPGGLFNAGSAFVYSGASGALLYQKNGAAIVDLLGSSVAGAGDVNGDGRADFIVGARLADVGGLVDAGSALVYSGATGALLYQKNGSAVGQGLGRSVSGGGDLDGDGRADFILGASDADPAGLTDAGSAWVYSGATGGLLYQKNGTTAYDNLGSSVALAGDVSGDGKADFLIGVPFADPQNLFDAGSALVYGLAVTDVPGERGNRPVAFELSQNYPNPFNPATTIRYYLFKRGNVTLEIFNLIGQRVRTLIAGEQPAGEHALIWDATDQRGVALASGVYFYRLTGKDFSETKPMIYLK